jgi:hypothetical protein
VLMGHAFAGRRLLHHLNKFLKNSSIHIPAGLMWQQEAMGSGGSGPRPGPERANRSLSVTCYCSLSAGVFSRRRADLGEFALSGVQ